MAIERSIRINVEAGRAKAELRSLQGSLRDTDRAAGAAATASRALGAAIAGFASVATIRQVASYADTYTNLQNQLKLATNSTEQLASSTQSLFEIAQNTRSSFEGTSDLYSRLARSTDNLGISNDRLLAVTETVNKAIAVSGTNAQTAQASLFQLGQGLSAGALRGEELNSVLEGTSRIGKVLADALTNGSIPALRKLASEGGLTAQKVINAFENQAEVIDQEYSRTSSTIEQAFTKINNELIKYVGEADKANNITKTVTGALDIFANNFSEIADTAIGVFVPALEAAAFVLTSRLIGSIASTTKARLADVAATAQHSAAIQANTKLDADKAKATQFVSLVTLNKVKAEESATLSALNNIKAVQSQLVAERELEVVRLKAQISDTGRAQSLSRLAEIRLAEATITAKVTAAETAHAAAKAKTTTAYNAYTAAAALATTATKTYSASVKAATIASRAGAIAVNGFKSAIAFLGGPVGVAITAATAIGFYAASLESAEEKTERIRQETDEFINSLQNANIIQFTTALFNAEEAADDAQTALDKANEELNRLISVGAGSSKVTEDLRIEISQLEANVATAEDRVRQISNTFSEAAKKAQEFGDAARKSITPGAFAKLKGEVDATQAAYNRFNAFAQKVNDEIEDGAEKAELLRAAEKKLGEELERISKKSEKSRKEFEKQHRSFEDLLGVFDPIQQANNRYNDILEEISNSTANDTQKKKLQSEAYSKLQEDIDNATTTAKEFLAQFDPIAAAEVRRIDLLKQLEKVQASASEKQALAAEIQRQYNKELDDAIPSFTELNAQFSAADAATVAYVDTLKQLDEAQRLGVDVTELRINALKAYQKAAEEARKQDILNTETSQSFFGALLQGLNDSAQTADSSFDQIREVGTQVLSGLSNEIAKFISTGKSDFRSFASAVIAELLRIQTNELFTEGFKLFKSSRDSGGGFFESIGSAVTGLFASRGAAFDGNARKFARGGLPTIGAFSGSVVSTPTKFAAGGTVNQMGEAGAEAILPLQRTAGGELGVNASGMAAPTQPNVNVDVPVQVINVTERPQDYLTSDAGVRQVINIVNQNKDAIA